MDTVQKNDANETPRWTLLRDLGVLQAKLIVDGLRDLLLVPASLVVGIISLMSGESGKPGPQFYNLLQWGKQSELWIDLFGAVKNSPEKADIPPNIGEQRMDDIVNRFESFVVDEYKRGGVTAQAKDQLDKFLNTLRRKQGD